MVENKLQSKQIYIFENTLYPLIKIGMSDNPTKRLITIENASGFPLKLYYESTPVLRPAIVENLIHKRLKDYRQKGEWFTLDKEIALKEIEIIIKDSEEGTYKDLTQGFELSKECVEVYDFSINNYETFMGSEKYLEEEEFIYKDKQYNYYLIYKQGDLVRTVRFCNLGLAKKFKKIHIERLLKMK